VMIHHFAVEGGSWSIMVPERGGGGGVAAAWEAMARGGCAGADGAGKFVRGWGAAAGLACAIECAVYWQLSFLDGDAE